MLWVQVLAPTTGCKDEGSDPPAISLLQLSIQDASCTEAWLRVRLDATAQARVVILKRDTTTIFNQTIVSTDTIIIAEGLLPHAAYQYEALRLSNGSIVERTPTLQITTMDTTSHNIVWELDTLGDASSILNDIAIVNDTLAYAVGEMYLRDSTGQIDPIPYGVALWNGDNWKLKRVFAEYPGQNTTLLRPTGIVAFAPADVWFAWYDAFHWDGTSDGTVLHWLRQQPGNPNPVLGPNQGIGKLWGTTSQNLFGGGQNGSVAHYSGQTWQRVETGTSLNVRDIWGASNQSGQTEILALASTYTAQTQETRVFQIVGNAANPVSAVGLAPDIASVWFKPGRKYYAAGAGVHRKRMLNDSTWTAYPHGVVTNFGSDKVRGKDINDVFVVGSFGEIVHFNGVTWHRYFGSVPLPTGAYSSVAVTEHLVIAVGDIGASRAIAMIGRR